MSYFSRARPCALEAWAVRTLLSYGSIFSKNSRTTTRNEAWAVRLFLVLLGQNF
jgi:hypothetical protein